MMNKEGKIYVAGHRGMVGSAIVRSLERNGYHNIITRTHKELDLTRQDQVEKFFAEEKPDYVFLAAAKVGGIVANGEALADFMYDNMILEMNVIHEAWKNNCKKTSVPGFQLYLSAYGTAAYERELPSDFRAGEDQRGLCTGKDQWSEILRVPEPSVRNRLYQLYADQSVRTE